MNNWKDDNELFQIAKRELFVALIRDVLDKIGYHHQLVSQNVKPVRSEFYFS